MTITEAHMIAQLKQSFPSHLGDDAAILPYTNDSVYVISKDLLIEDVHFRCAYAKPKDLAHKALHVNLSDLAAMGACARYVMLGLAIPPHYADSTKAFLRHFAACCKASSVVLIGGDTTRSADRLSISLTAIGTAHPKNIVYRHTAKSHHIITYAGHLGWASIGLRVCETGAHELSTFKTHFLRPKALLEEGAWLSKQDAVSAMMDCSDGLWMDVKRLCNASNVAGYIDLATLTVSPSFNAACAHLSLDPIDTMLSGGEDYGLLCTMCASDYLPLAEAFNTAFGHPLRCVGHLQSGVGVHLLEKGVPTTRDLKPFSHFGTD